MKILLVDDSLLDRKLVGKIIKKAGIDNEIIEASDGQEALDIVGKNFHDIGLILLDWQMPNMDGIAFMKAVVKVPQVADIPIIMITASGSQENKDYAHQVNPKLAGYVVKPYKPETITDLVKEILKKNNDRRRL